MSEVYVRIDKVVESGQYAKHGWLHLSCGHRVLFAIPLGPLIRRDHFPCNSCASGQKSLAKGKGAEKDADQEKRDPRK